MNIEDNRVFYLNWNRITGVIGILGLLVFGLCTTPVSASPLLGKPMRLDESSTFCQGLRIAALGPERVVVGWSVAEGSKPGIYFRQRQNLIWEPVRQAGGVGGDQPRDLDMTFDARGRLHMVWTAMNDTRRALYYARIDDATSVPQAAELKITPPETTSGDADFPILGAEAGGGVVLVWQESQAMLTTVHAARLPEAGVPQDLGLVSGASLSGMAPQILSTSPLNVAWCEISESGSELRVDEWQPLEGRWRPSAAERQARNFPGGGQVLLDSTPAGMIGCWQDLLANGHSAIQVGLALQPKDTLPAKPATQTLAEPPGDHSRPHLSGSLPGHLTLSWQVFAQGQQSIRLASTFKSNPTPEVVTVSAPDQRFAAMPDHVTRSHWSGVVWTDDVRDGGTGGVYFAEVTWPAGRLAERSD